MNTAQQSRCRSVVIVFSTLRSSSAACIVGLVSSPSIVDLSAPATATTVCAIFTANGTFCLRDVADRCPREMQVDGSYQWRATAVPG